MRSGEIKNRRKFRRWRVLIFVFIIVISSFFVYFRFQKTPQKSEITGVQKTTETTGYIKSNKSVTSLKKSPDEIVSDTGLPSWVQIHSEGSGNQLTDLSAGNFKIFKAHNVKVLKTATSIHMPVMKINELVKIYPNALIMNASGFNMTTDEVTGFQINNGKLFKDWGSDKRATDAFVINQNGSCKIYDASTAASTLLKNGAAMSFSFGSILIRDGKVQTNDGSVDWMIHSFIGNDKENNLYLIISDTNTGYDNIMAKFKELGLENVILMDGGGSSQMSFEGKTIYSSQDNRAVNDYIILK